MKSIITISFLFCLLSCPSAFAQSGEVNSEQIIVRIYEGGGMNPSEILIAYGPDQVESVDIKNSSNTKNWQSNLGVIFTVLDRIRKEGYSIVNSSAVGGDAMRVTTYVFLRDDLLPSVQNGQKE